MNVTKAAFYDTSLEDRIKMYDQFPYTHNVNLCNSDTVRLYSGNVIKSSTYNNLTTVKTISNHDDVVKAKLALLKEKRGDHSE